MRFDAGHALIPSRDGCECAESEDRATPIGFTIPSLQLAGKMSPESQEFPRRCARYARLDAEVTDPASFLVVQLGVTAMNPATATGIPPASSDDPTDAGLPDDSDKLLVDDSDELLVEEISIDGMCGVY